LALQEPELSPRELATGFIDQRQYFVPEASVYRLLKARGLITSPPFILLRVPTTSRSPHRGQLVMASRLHLSAGHKLGLVLSVGPTRRLAGRARHEPYARGKPYYPMTQGKIERYHRSLKKRILPKNYYLPDLPVQLQERLAEFVAFYNTQHYNAFLSHKC
jgi:hypothetical protein